MVKEVGEAGPEVLLLYASQTGNAQAIAEDLSEQLGGEGIKAKLRCCSQRGAADALRQVSCLVLVASTTGEVGRGGDVALTLVTHWSGPRGNSC